MEPVIRVEKLVKRYAGRGLGRRSAGFTAVDSVCFSILPGSTLALVGESRSRRARCAGVGTSGAWRGVSGAKTSGVERRTAAARGNCARADSRAQTAHPG